MNLDEQYMRRALELARSGLGRVSPNPMVGAVIVHKGTIIGEGWHMDFGGPHAEVNAVNSVENAKLLSESTIYVTLEPCSHHGKTPPCADLLVSKKFKRVVIGNVDPNPKVHGGGIRKLKEAGIEVVSGVLDAECRALNKSFFVNQLEKRPYVMLKWAQTADGFIAREDFTSKWISRQESRALVHKWRSEYDAILIGKNTAKYDNPSLTVRDWTGIDPLRVIIDRNHELPEDLEVFQGAPQTVCYTRNYASSTENTEWKALGEDMGWEDVLNDLYQMGVGTLMVEGGAGILKSLISTELWDEARIFVGDNKFETGIGAPDLPLSRLNDKFDFPDTLYHYINTKSNG